jgi:hypothetical protein
MIQHGDMELMMDVEGGAILRGLHTRIHFDSESSNAKVTRKIREVFIIKEFLYYIFYTLGSDRVMNIVTSSITFCKLDSAYI